VSAAGCSTDVCAVSLTVQSSRAARVASCAEKIYFIYTITVAEAALQFEFDERKSRAIRPKYGIDFVAAQALWLDELLIEIPVCTTDEPRVSWLWA
jgi:hypothetical protein